MSDSTNKYLDLEIYTDEFGKRYSKDTFVSGLYRFTNIVNTSIGQPGITDPNMPWVNLNPGMFKHNSSKWDVRKACEWLHNNSYPYYIKGKCGACAKAVRSAIDIGFNTNPNGGDSYTGRAGRPTWAWHYIDFLPKIGFKFIAKVSRDKMKSFKAEPGDIAAYQKNCNPKTYGHICMWTGLEWASDFKQNSMIVYGGTPEAYVFRFNF